MPHRTAGKFGKNGKIGNIGKFGKYAEKTHTLSLHSSRTYLTSRTFQQADNFPISSCERQRIPVRSGRSDVSHTCRSGTAMRSALCLGNEQTGGRRGKVTGLTGGNHHGISRVYITVKGACNG